MKRSHILYSILPAAGILCFMMALLSLPVHAGTIQPSGWDDAWNIMEEMNEHKSVTLQKGKTYHISSMIYAKDGCRINATGARIICDRDILANHLTKTNYKSLNGFTIKGGTWVTKLKDGIPHSFIKFTHAQNINLVNMTIKACNYESHTIELVACKNVKISGCKISGKGTPKAKSVEEAIQIDVATPSTAPYISDKDKFCNGAGCKNITIKNCTIKGSRAVSANSLNRSGGKKYKKTKNYHSNIVVTGCNLTGLRAEAICIYNTLTATVKNNKMTTKSTRLKEAYSVGCHFHLFYPGSKKMAAGRVGKILVSGNTIHGGRQALNFDSHSNAKYGKVIVKNNKLYCKKGSANALHAGKVTSLSKSGNTMKNWK